MHHNVNENNVMNHVYDIRLYLKQDTLWWNVKRFYI